jgi:hypothetical protein
MPQLAFLEKSPKRQPIMVLPQRAKILIDHIVTPLLQEDSI